MIPALVELFGFVVGCFLNSPEDGDRVAVVEVAGLRRPH